MKSRPTARTPTRLLNKVEVAIVTTAPALPVGSMWTPPLDELPFPLMTVLVMKSLGEPVLGTNVTPIPLGTVALLSRITESSM